MKKEIRFYTMKLGEILNKNLICFSELEKKKDNLEVLIQMIEKENLVEDKNQLRKSIFEREDLMSTGIGLGIAIPHVRIKGVDDIIISILINKKGVKDYDSLDGMPVRIIIMIVASDEQHRDYLILLSRIVKMLKKDFIRKSMVESITVQEVIDLISENFDSDPLK
ncbi:MAG: PTS sugar transporter subunit IIA [Candidatus Aminicenantes bacterium]|nr:PTS sugar transporter subunit IIA [Candidatus Aminicenantes bacterium]